MTKIKVTSTLLLVMWVAASVVHAISVRQNEPVVTNRGIETVWDITGDGEPIRVLNVVSPIDVHVEHVPQNDASVLAKVVLLGNSKRFADSVDVFTAKKSDGVELVISNKHHESIRGRWVAHVQLASAHTLVSIENYGSGSIILKDKVVANGKDLVLATTGSGDLFVDTSDALKLGLLTISSSGSGDIQFRPHRSP